MKLFSIWATLRTDPIKNNRKWDKNEFFETGKGQVSRDLQLLRKHGIQIKNGQALDFGCGIGRLTNALAEHFNVVHGADVSAKMVELAGTLNMHPGKVSFFHNPNTNLSNFTTGAYDFVYSIIVLQHIPTRYQAGYITEFLRLLSDHGIAFFHTIRCVGWRRLVPNWAAELVRRLKHNGRAFIPMYGINPHRIQRLCEGNDCRIFYHVSFPYSPPYAGRFRNDLYGISKKSNPQQFKE